MFDGTYLSFHDFNSHSVVFFVFEFYLTLGTNNYYLL